MITKLMVETAFGSFMVTTAYDAEIGEYIEVKQMSTDRVIGNIDYQSLDDMDYEQLECLEDKIIELF